MLELELDTKSLKKQGSSVISLPNLGIPTASGQKTTLVRREIGKEQSP
jgi:hypothetical protein